MSFSRIKLFLSDPELLKFFFLLRIYRVLTKISAATFDVSTKEMKRQGLQRIIRSGAIYYVYKGQTYGEEMAQGHAMWNIRDKALQFCKGKGLDIGCNKWPLTGAHPVDNDPDENAYRLDKWEDGSLDFVFSSHCLEHLAEWRDALALWSGKLKKGGILFLYLPHESMTLWLPGSPWVGDDHVWSPTADVISSYLQELGMEIVEVDQGPDNFHSFHVVATKG